MSVENEFGQAVGDPLLHWKPSLPPGQHALEGREVRLEPVDPTRHAAELFDAYSPADDAMWTYMSYGPFRDSPSFIAWMNRFTVDPDPFFYTWILDGRPRGLSSFMRVAPQHGSIEIGHVLLARALRRTRAATEGFFLMMRHAFRELGYRRLEWKCDALNAPSRVAALRLGFTFEGIFRKHMVIKHRSRDTAWFAVTDQDWPGVETALELWLDPANFDGEGRQHRRLAEVRNRSRGNE